MGERSMELEFAHSQANKGMKQLLLWFATQYYMRWDHVTLLSCDAV
jgi:hypothetical protein